jgi:hypothetical protein
MLARHGWQALARGASVAAMGLDAAGIALVASGAGVQHMGRIAHMLAGRHDRALGAVPEPTGEPSTLSPALVRAVRLAPPGSEVLLATGAEGIAPEDEPALARLARRRRVRLLLPLDPIDTAPPARALPIHTGPFSRVARLQPVDTQALAARLRALNVSLEVIADDAG